MPSWIIGTKIAVPSNTAMDFEALYLSTYYNSMPVTEYRLAGVRQNPSFPTPGVWTALDLSAVVPAGAIGVSLSTMFVITDGSASNDPDLAINWQAHNGGGNPLKYVEEGISIGATGGVRQTEFNWCPCDANRVIDFSWLRGDVQSTPVEFPTGPFNNAYPVGAAYALWTLIGAVAMA